MRTKLLSLSIASLALAACQSTDFFTRLTTGEPIVADAVWLRVATKVQDTDVSEANYIPATCLQPAPAAQPAAPPAFVVSEPGIATCTVDMKTLIDRRFAKWMDTLSGADSGGNTLVDITVIGAGLAGGLAGGETARIMSAVTSGLTGSKSAIEKDVFLTQSLQTIVTQIHTDRHKLSTIIDQRVAATRGWTSPDASPNTATPYASLADAMNDLQNYARQGSFRNALYNLQTNAAAQSAACQAADLNQKAGIRPSTPAPPSASPLPTSGSGRSQPRTQGTAPPPANLAATTATTKCPDASPAPPAA